MRRLRVPIAWCLLSLAATTPAATTPAATTPAGTPPEVPESRMVDALVFGSFASPDNARRWAERVARRLDAEVFVARFADDNRTWYRVVSRPDAATARKATAEGLRFWRNPVEVGLVAGLTESPQAPEQAPETVAPSEPPQPRSQRRAVEPVTAQSAPRDPGPSVTATRTPSVGWPEPVASSGTESQFDIDLGFQSRSFTDSGFSGQQRFHPSVSIEFEYYRAWADGTRSFTVTPFARYDFEDEERTHADLREFFFSSIENNWEAHIGVRQVFWGVTEFQHLVDIVNQTDLVENIDGEDKLGQPMVQLSWVGDYGVIDLMALTGFRERTFPGEDGRLTVVPIDADEPLYESSAEQGRTDFVARWAHMIGPVEFGVYHFSGTSRDPVLVPTLAGDASLVYVPFYPVIDQTGLDAQAITGDWAWKLEAISRSGFGDRYAAAVAGFERTFVGAFGTRADVGLVVEYMFDERGDEAFNTIFENDLAVGARWRANDLSDTEALLGLIWDTDTEEYVFSLEGSRRLGDTWSLIVEGRVFGGGDDLTLPYLLDPDNKTAALQRDDYIQIELKKFF